MKREIIVVKIDRPKRRAQFLFNDGEFKPKKEKSIKGYSRREKYRNRDLHESMVL